MFYKKVVDISVLNFSENVLVVNQTNRQTREKKIQRNHVFLGFSHCTTLSALANDDVAITI